MNQATLAFRKSLEQLALETGLTDAAGFFPPDSELRRIASELIVFLGPSLEREAAEKILPAEYLPPAKRGDLLRAAQDGAGIIGLIDGVFHQESAVAHREILAALKKGVRVVGASSMGALRAAEMDTLGMTGIARHFATLWEIF